MTYIPFILVLASTAIAFGAVFVADVYYHEQAHAKFCEYNRNIKLHLEVLREIREAIKELKNRRG